MFMLEVLVRLEAEVLLLGSMRMSEELIDEMVSSRGFILRVEDTTALFESKRLLTRSRYSPIDFRLSATNSYFSSLALMGPGAAGAACTGVGCSMTILGLLGSLCCMNEPESLALNVNEKFSLCAFTLLLVESVMLSSVESADAKCFLFLLC